VGDMQLLNVKSGGSLNVLSPGTVSDLSHRLADRRVFGLNEENLLKLHVNLFRCY
jgi:hypothetical protein